MCLKYLCVVLACLVMHVTPMPAGREVAITIDDLPRGGDGGPRTLADVRAMTSRLLQPFRDQRIPVIGFVNAGRQAEVGVEGLRQLLDLWLDAGADLGNHSSSHFDINNVPLDQYTADIVAGEPILRAALTARGKTLRFYRHPFLHAGPTADVKKGLQDFLDGHGYRVAPVTLDNSDYQYAALYTRPQYRERVRQEYVPYMESIVAFFEAALNRGRGPGVSPDPRAARQPAQRGPHAGPPRDVPPPRLHVRVAGTRARR